MRCEEILALASQYLEGDTTRAQAVQISEHLQTCAQCSEQIEQREHLLQSLRAIPVPAHRSNLAQRIIEDRQKPDRLGYSSTPPHRRAAKNPHWRWYWAGVGSSLAAGLLAFFLINISQTVMSPQQETTVHAELNRLQNVNILVHSDQAIDDVKFSIAIPAGLELRGYRGRRQLA